MTRRPVALDRTTSKPTWIRPPGARIRRRSASNRRMPGTDGGRLGISNTRCPSAASASAWTSACRSRPRTAGMPMRQSPAGSAAARAASARRRQVASSKRRARAWGQVVQPIEHREVDVDRADLGRAVRPCGGREVACRVRRPRIGVATDADHDEPGSGPRLERGGLGERQDRGAAERADGGGDRDQRAVERAGVRQALGFGSRQVGGDGRVRVRGERAIGVAIGPGETADAVARRRRAVRSRHVEAAVRPVRGRHALGGQEHARSRLCQLGGAREAGQPGPDDDDVSARHGRALAGPAWCRPGRQPRACRGRCRP